MKPTANHNTKRIVLGFIALVLLCAVTAARHVYAAGAPERRNQVMIRAVASRNIALVSQLLKEGADPNTFFRFLDEPIESQGFSPRALWIRFSRSRGCPVMHNGTTALTRAIEADSPEIVKLLIDAGAEVNERDWWGQMPLAYATTEHQLKTIEYLKAAGAK